MPRKRLYLIFGISEPIYLFSMVMAWGTFVYGMPMPGLLLGLFVFHLLTLIPFGMAVKWWNHTGNPRLRQAPMKSTARVAFAIYLIINWGLILYHIIAGLQPRSWSFG